jgi:hypothetical protein
MSGDPIRLRDDPESPALLRSDMERAARRGFSYNKERGLARLAASIQSLEMSTDAALFTMSERTTGSAPAAAPRGKATERPGKDARRLSAQRSLAITSSIAAMLVSAAVCLHALLPRSLDLATIRSEPAQEPVPLAVPAAVEIAAVSPAETEELKPRSAPLNAERPRSNATVRRLSDASPLLLFFDVPNGAPAAKASNSEPIKRSAARPCGKLIKTNCKPTPTQTSPLRPCGKLIKTNCKRVSPTGI